MSFKVKSWVKQLPRKSALVFYTDLYDYLIRELKVLLAIYFFIYFHQLSSCIV